MRYLYSTLFYLALPFVILRLLWRSRRLPAYRRRWRERFGYCPFQLNQCIWIHAVSVGETVAAISLIKALKTTYPTLPIVVTNMTPTGAARVKAVFGESVWQSYVPYDLPDSINRFLKRINPQIAIIMETELWPNLFARCKKLRIPLVIVNARLSSRSAKRYSYVSSVTREMLSTVSMLAAQGKLDAERFEKLGLLKDKISVTGNLKFDVELPQDLGEKSQVLRHQWGIDRFVWIAASTHPTEEEIILTAHKKILEKNSSALLILVPRHPDRFDEVAMLVQQHAFKFTRRSSNELSHAKTEVYLGDTMGEMLLMYSACDVAFVSGSFAPIGGHNILEPAALGKPILTGPHLFNFAEISRLLLTAQGMTIVNNAEELALQVLQFFEHETIRKTMGNNALRIVEANRGALQRQMTLIQQIMNKSL